MQWQGRRSSGNVEDQRGGGGIGGIVGFGGIGTLVIAAIVYFLGGDPSQVLQQGQMANPVTNNAPIQQTAEEKELAEFVGVVLADTEDVWNTLFKQINQQYREPKLVLFTGQVQSACGGASAAIGPFYCPGDEKAYIDLSFYNELKNRFGAGGDFAMAYVIAHEIGHHVQNQLGISDKVNAMRGKLSETDFNKLSVKQELQADFFAGIWAHYNQKMKNVIEAGDIEEALTAANAIGDDALQKQAQGYVVPDAFTHGTSAQRIKWFKLGYETGDLGKGDTFNTTDL